jgi:cellulose synthase/poly-beta-1,6-N-acetylglucosamine synthase-like glycosyltransferase
MLLTLIAILYLLCALALTAYAASQLLLLLIYWRHRRDEYPTPQIDHWPSVLIQLPIYNERHVVERLLDAVAALDYPRDRLFVQLLDDSTDETVQIAAQHVAGLQRAGLNIEHVRREDRSGYKAGALAYGLGLIGDQAEYAVVLDADFVLPPNFLRRTIPLLVVDPGLGMVQTRWGHLNTFMNPLTMGQTLAIDGHFVVEQTARSRGGWLMTFNGSGGVWRISAIHASGGWRDLTLTEDLDLSYRAQLAGWRFLYLPDMVVPGELPPQIAAFKQQQARWAKGSTQCLRHTFAPLWRSRFTFFQRLMATLHLCQYMPAPIMLLLLILTPPLLVTGVLRNLPLGLLGLIGLATPVVYIVSQVAIYPDWIRRMLAYPVLVALGIGISWSNAKAVIGGFFDLDTEFRRTPKFVQGWQASSYALRHDSSLLVEALLCLYSGASAVLAAVFNPAFAPYLAIYSFAFALIALWGIKDRLALSRQSDVAAQQQTNAVSVKL